MTTSDIKNIIAQGESETVEFKQSFNKTVTETIVAFSNTKDGKIIIGIKNDGNITGISLIEAFYLTGDIEKYGTGFSRIKEWFKQYPNLSFRIQDLTDFIQVKIYNPNIKDVGIRLNYLQIEIINLIKKNKYNTTHWRTKKRLLANIKIK